MQNHHKALETCQSIDTLVEALGSPQGTLATLQHDAAFFVTLDKTQPTHQTNLKQLKNTLRCHSLELEKAVEKTLQAERR